MSNMILRLRMSDGFLVLRTFDAKHRSSSSFYVNTDRLHSWLDDACRLDTFYDVDLDNILRVYKENDALVADILWMHPTGSDSYTGYRQRFTLEPAFVNRLCGMKNTGEVKLLIHTNVPMGQSCIVLSPEAQKRVQRMPFLQRNAFRKFLRNAFTWGHSSTICVHIDWGNDFCFTEYTARGRGISGGICLSKDTHIGRDGQKHPVYRYSIHT